MLKVIAMVLKITSTALPGNQHDTGSTALDSLYADIAALRRLAETLNSTIQDQNAIIQGLKATIQELTAAVQKQDKTVEEQKNEISKLTDLLKKKESELSESKELVKTLKTLLSSKEVDLNALRRLLFQGGREQKKDKKDSASQSAEEKQKQPHVNSPRRNRQSNSAKTDCCDSEKEKFLDFNGNALAASTRDDASKEIAQTIEKDGRKYAFKGFRNLRSPEPPGA